MVVYQCRKDVRWGNRTKMKYLLKIILFVLVLSLGCNTSSEYDALCEEAQHLTRVEMDQHVIGRQLVWKSTVDEVIQTDEGDYLVFIEDNHMQVNYVPKRVAVDLRKGEPFNFVGVLTEFNDICFGEITFNELNQ